MRVPFALVCVVLSLGLVQGPAQVTALVTVLAESGEPVRTLTAADFIVREGRSKREVIAASVMDQPLSVALLVDTAKPPMGEQAPVQDLRAGLTAFVATLRRLDPGAVISLTEVGGAAVRKVDFTAPASAMDEAIARLYPDLSAQSVLLEALVDAASALRGRPMPRRAIVSVDANSIEGGQDPAMDRAIKAVGESGATYWAISIRGVGRSDNRRDRVLAALTKSSGGLRTFAAQASGLPALLTQAAATLASQYSISFARPAGQAMSQIQVECACGNQVFVSPMMR